MKKAKHYHFERAAKEAKTEECGLEPAVSGLRTMAYAGTVIPFPALTGLLLLVSSALPAEGQSRDFGVDVSHYQGSSGISQSAWNQMFAEGRRFGGAIHREPDLEPVWDYAPFKELLRPRG